MDKIKVSDAEWRIMKVLWGGADRTLGEIIEALGEENHWSYTTVRTLLVRLVEKKAVEADKSTGVYRYRAIYDEKECVKVEVRSFLSRVFDNSPVRLIAALVEDGEIDEKERKEILRLLSELHGEEENK